MFFSHGHSAVSLFDKKVFCTAQSDSELIISQTKCDWSDVLSKRPVAPLPLTRILLLSTNQLDQMSREHNLHQTFPMTCASHTLHASSLHPQPTRSCHRAAWRAARLLLPSVLRSSACLSEALGGLVCVSKWAFWSQSGQSVLRVPLGPHLHCTNSSAFWSVPSVSLGRPPLQSADPGRRRAVGGPGGLRRDRQQTNVATLLPHCPAAR